MIRSRTPELLSRLHIRLRRQGLRKTVARSTEFLRASARATLARKDLVLSLQHGSLHDAQIVLVSVMRDDGSRLPFWIHYYRTLGVDHFIIVDNNSTDDTMTQLSRLDYVTVYRTNASYKKSHYGIDWVNAIARQWLVGKWVLFVDSDEFLSFDGQETRSLTDLVGLLERRSLSSLQCLLLDMYGRNTVQMNVVAAGGDPFAVCNLYDGEGYRSTFERATLTTWIKGGVRGRLFFADNVNESPALNKSPLVRWTRRTLFVQSSHRLLPASMNRQSLRNGLTGVLLHQKFLASVGSKAADSAHVAQHDPEYRRYARFADVSPYVEGLTCTYKSSADLVSSGLLVPINWDG